MCVFEDRPSGDDLAEFLDVDVGGRRHLDVGLILPSHALEIYTATPALKQRGPAALRPEPERSGPVASDANMARFQLQPLVLPQPSHT